MTLRATGLRKSYNGITVVEDISMHVELGEIVGLLGPNGAGKTTCFYTIVGLVRADSGQVFIDKTELTDAAMHQRAAAGLGYLPQEASVFRTLTTEANLLAMLELNPKLDAAARQAKMTSLLEEFSLHAVRSSLGQSLSGGERRRLEIARALASDPKYILLDEPFAGVDPISVSDIKAEIKGLAARGIGVLITDHNVRETLDICDRAYVVHEGHVIADGAPAKILANNTVQNVYLGKEFA
ncbi:MAG TPA: LPS export ABC transporter ATP-binding protein [Gammaproteobacteria bacterium]|jgi:lipopolysaccharide export system ATP-binding protein|nr:LPS export ABC transporter ATP-binding protein [Gammaproteobacteria bacterium]|tara:strand:+ start:8376 stop:9095 length:720 start_codon:yes stop_codon:yes gene_type:complete